MRRAKQSEKQVGESSWQAHYFYAQSENQINDEFAFCLGIQ